MPVQCISVMVNSDQLKCDDCKAINVKDGDGDLQCGWYGHLLFYRFRVFGVSPCFVADVSVLVIYAGVQLLEYALTDSDVKSSNLNHTMSALR